MRLVRLVSGTSVVPIRSENEKWLASGTIMHTAEHVSPTFATDSEKNGRDAFTPTPMKVNHSDPNFSYRLVNTKDVGVFLGMGDGD